jgi:hypothetical protein
MIDQQPAMFVWAAAVGLALAAGAWTAVNRRATRPALPLEHVAGAAILGVFAWEMLVHLPGTVMGYWSLTAGLGDVRGLDGYQVFVVAQVAFVIGAAFAIVGILRRRAWGAILGIGLAVARGVWSGAVLYETLSMFGDEVGNDLYLDFVTSVIGLQAIPALVVVALLAWPLVRRTAPGAEATEAQWPAGSVPVENAD